MALTQPALVEMVALHARDSRSRGSIAGLSLALSPGVHAFLGAPEDGTVALFEALSGAERCVRGSVRVAGADPHRSAAARARIGALPPEPSLPEARSVRGAARLATSARGGDMAAFERASRALGIEALADRAPSSLAFADERAVELALALSTEAPALVLLFEPLAEIAPQTHEALAARLAELAAEGAVVVVITSSLEDASTLADHLLVLARGVVSAEQRGRDDAEPVRLRAWLPDGQVARRLAAALTADEGLREVRLEEGASPGEPACIEIEGRGAERCSLALLDAAAELDCEILALRHEGARR